MSIFRGPATSFRGFGIERDQPNFSSVTVNEQFRIPLILSTDPPQANLVGVGGGIAYDTVTQRPYFSNGTVWAPINTGGTGTTESYSIIKGAALAVPTSTETAIAGLTIAGSATYHTITGWNLASGVYTAPTNSSIVIQVNLAWTAGVSNLGDRSMRIQYRLGGIGAWNTVKEVITQGDPDINVETTQEAQISLRVLAGDEVRIAVFHDSPIPITVAGGNHTSVSGVRVN